MSSRPPKQTVMTPDQFARALNSGAAIDEPDYEVVSPSGEGHSLSPSPSPSLGVSRAHVRAASGGEADHAAPSPTTPNPVHDEAFKRKFDAYRAGLQERYGNGEASAAAAAGGPPPPAASVSPALPTRSVRQGEASPPHKPAQPAYQIRVDAPLALASSAAVGASGGYSAAGLSGSGSGARARLRSSSRGAYDEKHALPSSPLSAPAYGSGEGQQIEGAGVGGEGQPNTTPEGHVEGVKGSPTETGLDAFEVQKLLEAKDPDFDAKKKNDREAKRRRIRKRIERWSTTLQRKYPILHTLETKTGVNKVYIVLAAFLALFAMAFFGLGMNHLSDLIGFTYPVFRSYKCLERPHEQRDELRYWLVYWVVFGLFGTVEAMTDSLLSWVPFYYPLKLAFLMWCFLPSSKGAQTVYDVVVRPTLARHEHKIDSGLHSVRAAASSAVAEVGSVAARTVRNKSFQLSGAVKQKFVESVLGPRAAGAAASPEPTSPPPVLGADAIPSPVGADVAAANGGVSGGVASPPPTENRI